MKTIGILGGMGPQATMDFEQRVHRVAQKLLPIKAGMGYPPMVVFYFREPPIEVDENHLPTSPLRPNLKLLDFVARIGPLADFVVITSNTPHLFLTEIERAVGKPVLNMIEIAIAELKRRGWQRVGVLGVGETAVYTRRQPDNGLKFGLADPETRNALNRSIFRVMEGRNDESDAQVARDAVAQLRSRGVDGVILGCTEIPLLLGSDSEADDLINPAQLLAEAAVKYAVS